MVFVEMALLLKGATQIYLGSDAKYRQTHRTEHYELTFCSQQCYVMFLFSCMSIFPGFHGTERNSSQDCSNCTWNRLEY